MRRIIVILTFSFVSFSLLMSQTTTYQPGEKITYLIKYGFINGGIATLEVNNDTCCGTRETYHSVLTGKTTGLVDAIFEVKDIYESYIDPETEMPVKSVRNISEGRYRRYNEVMFDRVSRQDSAVLESDLTGTHIAQPDIHDILSCFYWFRNRVLPHELDSMEIGDSVVINTWFTDELFPIIMRYWGTETIKTKAGTINCYKFGPVCEVGRLFKYEDAISFWFSADSNYLPVMIRFDIVVGAFEVNMVGYEGLKYPLAINNK